MKVTRIISETVYVGAEGRPIKAETVVTDGKPTDITVSVTGSEFKIRHDILPEFIDVLVAFRDELSSCLEKYEDN